jgi:uncharacterized membrane protein SpoIIM required for sporulation
VKQEEFVARHTPRWLAFEAVILPPNRTGKKTKGKTVRATAELEAKAAAESATFDVKWPLEEMPHRYREVCHHLALARDRQYGTALIERLEKLVLAGHQALYGEAEIGGAVSRFLLGGFSRLVRKHWRYMLVSGLLFFGPLIACIVAVQWFPDFAYVIVSPEQLADVQQMYAPENMKLGKQRGADNDFLAFTFYVANNVRIDFQCFAGGMLFGVGSLFFLLYNALSIGVIAGHLTHVGYIETFWGFVAGHSAFELTGVVLSGAAGLMLGMPLISPGRLSRFAAVKERLPDIIGIVYGAALLTFLAAFIEAFWSASRLPPVEVKYAVGIILWIVTLSYLAFAGRRSLPDPFAEAARAA